MQALGDAHETSSSKPLNVPKPNIGGTRHRLPFHVSSTTESVDAFPSFASPTATHIVVVGHETLVR
jgi:hypothetical protein